MQDAFILIGCQHFHLIPGHEDGIKTLHIRPGLSVDPGLQLLDLWANHAGRRMLCHRNPRAKDLLKLQAHLGQFFSHHCWAICGCHVTRFFDHRQHYDSIHCRFFLGKPELFALLYFLSHSLVFYSPNLSTFGATSWEVLRLLLQVLH